VAGSHPARTRGARPPAGNILIGTTAQITDNLRRLNEAGLTMALMWPPFQDVPVSKTLDDLKRLKEEILPAVNAV
jgi:FMNH2-dependent dimethyl sulfone monooxygenase